MDHSTGKQDRHRDKSLEWKVPRHGRQMERITSYINTGESERERERTEQGKDARNKENKLVERTCKETIKRVTKGQKTESRVRTITKRFP